MNKEHKLYQLQLHYSLTATEGRTINSIKDAAIEIPEDFRLRMNVFLEDGPDLREIEESTRVIQMSAFN